MVEVVLGVKMLAALPDEMAIGNEYILNEIFKHFTNSTRPAGSHSEWSIDENKGEHKALDTTHAEGMSHSQQQLAKQEQKISKTRGPKKGVWLPDINLINQIKKI